MRAAFVTVLLIAATSACSSRDVPTALDRGAPFAKRPDVSWLPRIASTAPFRGVFDGSAVRFANGVHGLEARVEAGVSRVSIGSVPCLALRLSSVGREGRSASVSTGATSEVAGEAHIDHGGGITEWLRNDAAGLEHAVVLRDPPAGVRGVVRVEMSSDAACTLRSESDALVSLVGPTGQSLGVLSGIAARDADGRQLAARLEVRAGAAAHVVTYVVDDREARYPIEIDPTIGTETRVTAPTPVQEQQFAYDLALSGDTAAIGVPAPTTSAGGRVMVMVLDPVTRVWSQQAVLQGDFSYYFGARVQLDVDTIAAGSAFANNGVGFAKGAVNVFQRTGSTWTKTALLTTASPMEQFGEVFALSGNVLAVVASSTALANRQVLVYKRSGTGTWGLAQTLTLAREIEALAVSSDTIVAGVPGEGVSGATAAGAIHVWRSDGSTFTGPTAIVNPELQGVAANNYFGRALALRNGTLLVGAPGGRGSIANEGLVRVYTTTGGAFTEVAKLAANDAIAGTNFGGSVALSRDTMLVGSPNASAPGKANAGAAYVFTRSGTTFTQRARITPDSLAAGDLFGVSVAVDGDLAIASAPQHLVSGLARAGAFYAYRPLVAYDNGRACAAGTECQSGNCVDGVCCNTACTEACRSCSVTGSIGTCSAVPDGAPVGTRMCTPSLTCKSGACDTTCTANGDCASGHYCKTGTCTPFEDLGTVCARDTDCKGGKCADGRCCNTACNGQCEACDVAGSEGTCAPISGAPHPGTATTFTRPACETGASTCAAKACDGVARTSCAAFANVGKACGAARCDEGGVVGASSCSDMGACVAPPRSSCGQYGCDRTTQACRTTCSKNEDCATGSVCRESKCDTGATCSADGLSSIAKDGAESSCNGFRCGPDGLCLTKCTASADCAPSLACDTAEQRCTAAPTAAGDDGGGCAMSSPRSSSGALALVVLGMCAAGAAARRRRRST